MNKKIIFLILDGLGDRPIKKFENKTPLEAAKTPNLDIIAEQGIEGIMKMPYKYRFTTSVEGHLSLFGYDIKQMNTNRGVFEALGTGIKLKEGDVALRVNFATVEPVRGKTSNGFDKNFKIIDRRAGRIKDTSKLAKVLDGMIIDGIKFLMNDSISHRSVLVMRGKGLSDKITSNDQHKVGINPVKIFAKKGGGEAGVKTAHVLNKFLAKAHQILESHQLNKQRIKKGFLPANYLLVREPGKRQNILSFEKKWGKRACCIAGGKLYKGISMALGMRVIEVKGATGKTDTNLQAKFKAAQEALKDKDDFCYLHIKGTDVLSHDGDCVGKKKFIEKIDRYLPILMKLKNVILIITGDHATPCELGEHSTDVVPVFIHNGPPKGAFGLIKANQLMKLVIGFAKTKKLC